MKQSKFSEILLEILKEQEINDKKAQNEENSKQKVHHPQTSYGYSWVFFEELPGASIQKRNTNSDLDIS